MISRRFTFFFFQAEDGIRDLTVTGFRRVLFRSRLAPQLGRMVRERDVQRGAGRAGGGEALLEEVFRDGERVAERRADGLGVEDLLLVDERQALDEIVHRADLLGLDLVAVEELAVHRAARVRGPDHRLELPEMQPVELRPRPRLRVPVSEILELDLRLVWL